MATFPYVIVSEGKPAQCACCGRSVDGSPPGFGICKAVGKIKLFPQPLLPDPPPSPPATTNNTPWGGCDGNFLLMICDFFVIFLLLTLGNDHNK